MNADEKKIRRAFKEKNWNAIKTSDSWQIFKIDLKIGAFLYFCRSLPQFLLISAKIVKGRKISGYYSIKDDINNAGGTYVDAPYVTDDNIVSCPHYKHLGPWMKEVIKQAKKPDAVSSVP